MLYRKKNLQCCQYCKEPLHPLNGKKTPYSFLILQNAGDSKDGERV